MQFISDIARHCSALLFRPAETCTGLQRPAGRQSIRQGAAAPLCSEPASAAGSLRGGRGASWRFMKHLMKQSDNDTENEPWSFCVCVGFSGCGGPYLGSCWLNLWGGGARRAGCCFAVAVATLPPSRRYRFAGASWACRANSWPAVVATGTIGQGGPRARIPRSPSCSGRRRRLPLCRGWDAAGMRLMFSAYGPKS